MYLLEGKWEDPDGVKHKIPCLTTDTRGEADLLDRAQRAAAEKSTRVVRVWGIWIQETEIRRTVTW